MKARLLVVLVAAVVAGPPAARAAGGVLSIQYTVHYVDGTTRILTGAKAGPEVGKVDLQIGDRVRIDLQPVGEPLLCPRVAKWAVTLSCPTDERSEEYRCGRGCWGFCVKICTRWIPILGDVEVGMDVAARTVDITALFAPNLRIVTNEAVSRFVSLQFSSSSSPSNHRALVAGPMPASGSMSAVPLTCSPGTFWRAMDSQLEFTDLEAERRVALQQARERIDDLCSAAAECRFAEKYPNARKVVDVTPPATAVCKQRVEFTAVLTVERPL